MTPERGPEGLRVGAITSFTTIDFPGKLAAVAFIQGCPWDCTYCQNPWLRPFKFDPQYEHESWESLIALLSRRKGLLDGVVFSGSNQGGEVTGISGGGAHVGCLPRGSEGDPSGYRLGGA